MKRQRRKTRQGSPPPSSRYARKKLEQAQGIRPLFEFATQPSVSEGNRIVTGRIESFYEGIRLLRTPSGRTFYVGRRAMQQAKMTGGIPLGSEVTCEIGMSKDGKGERVVKILSVVAPTGQV